MSQVSAIVTTWAYCLLFITTRVIGQPGVIVLLLSGLGFKV